MERAQLGTLSCLVKRTRAGAPTLVALHGRGAAADDLSELGDAIDPDMNQVYPDAPRGWPAANPVGRAWYDSGADRTAEVADSRARLSAALAAVQATISDGPIVLMGFSQGAVMTLDTGLRPGCPVKLLIALSGYLHEPLGSAESPPTLVVHGSEDDVVPVEKGRHAYETLTARGVRVTYQEYPMGHEIRPAVVRLIMRFLADAKL